MTDRTPEDGGHGTQRIVVVVVLVGVLAGAYLGARAVADWVGGLGGVSDVTAPPDLQPGVPVTIDVPPGSSARQIGAILADAGVVGSATQFELAVRSEGAAERLQAGNYELQTGMSPGQVIEVLLLGPVVDTFRVTVREGLWVTEVIAAIAEQTDFTAAELEAALRAGHVESELLEGNPADLVSWEGILFPDTYEFAVDVTPADVLQRLADTMEQRVASIDWSDLERRGLTLYEGIIIASLVEAEAKVDVDRPRIASVIINRLELPMVLGIDATVVYAVGERGTSLTVSDLAIDSPYNTRVVAGLPPTPIGAPGRKSLEAAAAPPATEFLYFVLTSASGEHSFTASYDEFLVWKGQAQEDGLIP